MSFAEVSGPITDTANIDPAVLGRQLLDYLNQNDPLVPFMLKGEISLYFIVMRTLPKSYISDFIPYVPADSRGRTRGVAMTISSAASALKRPVEATMAGTSRVSSMHHLKNLLSSKKGMCAW